MTRCLLSALLASTCLTVSSAPGQAKELTYSQILEQLIDLDRLPNLEEGIACKQASSYDRASRYDPKQDKYVNWAANGDSGHYIRVDPQTGEAIMAEIEGPGCIYRIWSANPQGKIRFYLDGATQPTYEFDFNELFTGKIEPFRRPLVWQRRVVLGGNNPASDCYLPIPFAKSCKVTADKPHRQYYHIGYQTFPKSWQVQTFHLPLTQAEQQTLQKVCRILDHCGQDPQPKPDAKRVEKTVTLEPGKRVTLARLDGPAVIYQFHAKLRSDERWAGRKVLLQMFWDGQDRPGVDTPIGDFFAEPFQEAPYKSLPMGITRELNYCYFRMPFRRSAEIVVVHQGFKPASLRYRIVYGQAKLGPNTAYFHAKWRREPNSEHFDYPILECTGRGRYVGTALFPDNILGGWWGEGDEKVYVDGEKFPSIFGTGSEDYFGDAWGIRYFENPYHGFPQRKLQRQQSCYRWHISDFIPFRQSFKITIENYAAHNPARHRNDYSSVAYWYQMPGGKDFFGFYNVEQRIPKGHIVADAIEAEWCVDPAKLPHGVRLVSDDDVPAPLSSSRGVCLTGRVGDAFVLTVPADQDDRYVIRLHPAKGTAASQYELLLGDEKITDRVTLRKGPNPITIRFVGKPVRDDVCELIVDYFILQPYRNFIQDWMVIGPFDNADDKGLQTVYPPEREIDLAKSYPGKGGKRVSWRKVSRKNGLILLGDVIQPTTDIVVYGACRIISPDDRKATLLVGSDDGVKVWLNGKLVHTHHAHRGLKPDEDRIPIRLRKGDNTLLIKIDQGQGPFGFAVRIADPQEVLRYALPE